MLCGIKICCETFFLNFSVTNTLNIKNLTILFVAFCLRVFNFIFTQTHLNRQIDSVLTNLVLFLP
jgi:hypothetical protein